MSTQMTVRLSDQATDHIDCLVRVGTFESRAQYLTWLVEREAQRVRAWADLQRQIATGTLNDPESDAIAKSTSGRSLAHLD